MKYLVEQDIEEAALEILQDLGYKYVYGPDVRYLWKTLLFCTSF